MCGIAGFSGNFDDLLLENMQFVISHRGPDDAGRYFNKTKGIGLAHRRLSIIDLSPTGHQPMWDSTQTVVIVFNGEIYNYRELRVKLAQDGFVFKSNSDTETLLNLYLRYGMGMFSYLNGIFAFALWDTREDTLFLARDGVGVKPLYYSESPKGLLFASELKAILQEPGIDKTINPEAIHYHLTYIWCPAPHTMLKSVKKLEPGQAMFVKNGKVQKRWQFYDLPYNQQIVDVSEKDAIIQVQNHIKQAVERQMVADVPVGAFLSGGLDSSSVVAFAKGCNPNNKMQCFTIGFKDELFRNEGMADDLPYAKRVAEHLGVDLNIIYVGSEMVDHVEKMIYHLDEPQADPGPLNALIVSQSAQEHGIKVLLSGVGGDDIFTGYRRHYALLSEKYWAWLPTIARKGLKNIAKMPSLNSSFGRRFSKAFQYADLDGDERLISYFYWANTELINSFYSDDMRKELNSLSPAKPLIATLTKLFDNVPVLNRMLYLEGKHFLTDHNLNYTDKMSMAVGVEVRVPLLDPDLIALAARLPVEYKQRGKIGKWIFKKAMEPYLPHDIIYRPKTGFGAPLRHWIKYELRPLVEEVLSEISLKNRGLFDPARVKKLLELDRCGRVDGAYTIFSLVCIELWCRIFLEGRMDSYGNE